MNTLQRNFLNILRDAVHPHIQTKDLSCMFDWKEIFAIALRQNLFPFIYDAASKYPGFQEFDDSHPEYMTVALSSMSKQIQNTNDFLTLYKHFLSANMTPIVMKGIVCRELYDDKADFRLSGDEDILIEKTDYKKAEEILEAAGYIKEDKEFDSTLNYMQEVTFTSLDSGLVIELHINPFGNRDDLSDKRAFF